MWIRTGGPPPYGKRGGHRVASDVRGRQGRVLPVASLDSVRRSAVERDGMALGGLDSLGGRVEQLVRQLRERTGRRQILTDQRNPRVVRRALGLAEAMEALARQLQYSV